MVTLREYAKSCNISYESIRTMIARHKEELEGHVHQYKRTRYLDDDAVEILDRLRAPKAMVIAEAAQLEDLQKLNAELMQKLISAQEQIIGLQGALADAQQRAALLPAAQAAAEQLQKELELEKAKPKSLLYKIFGKS